MTMYLKKLERPKKKVNDVESKVVVSKTCRGLSVSSDPEAGSHVTDSVSLPANSCRLDSIYPFKGDSFDISVTIEDFKFPALIDTGAAVTAISSQVWDKCLSHKNCCLDSSSTSRVTSVSGSPEGISPNPDKVRLVQEFPTPTNLKELRSFLGLANYYRRFVRGFSNIANPLNALTKKNVPFVWTVAYAEAFEKLKRALVSAPILAYPNFREPFLLFVDASSTGIGFTSAQIQNGKEVVIAYNGRGLNRPEQNYSTMEREALALVEGIKKFQPYLHNHKFTVVTDHSSLRWLMNVKDASGRLARWALLLQQYDFNIVHRPGRIHGNADCLSRRPYDSCEMSSLKKEEPQTHHNCND